MYNSENEILKFFSENRILATVFFITETLIVLIFLFKLLSPHFMKQRKNLKILFILGIVLYFSIMLPTIILMCQIVTFIEENFDLTSIHPSDIVEFIVVIFSLRNINNLLFSRKNSKDYIFISVIHNTFFTTNIIFKFFMELTLDKIPNYFSIIVLVISILIIFSNDLFEKPFEYCHINNGFIKRSHLSMLIIFDFFIIILTIILLNNIFSFFVALIYITLIMLYLIVAISIIMNLEYNDTKISENKELVRLKVYLEEKLNLIRYSTQNLLENLYNIMR